MGRLLREGHKHGRENRGKFNLSGGYRPFYSPDLMYVFHRSPKNGHQGRRGGRFSMADGFETTEEKCESLAVVHIR